MGRAGASTGPTASDEVIYQARPNLLYPFHPCHSWFIGRLRLLGFSRFLQHRMETHFLAQCSRRIEQRPEFFVNIAQDDIVGHQLLSISASRLKIVALARSSSRICTNARTTYTLIATARGLRRRVAAMMAPCSVKTHGRYFLCRPRLLLFKVTICDLKE